MDENELFLAVTSARNVLRVETLGYYDVGSDGDHYTRYVRNEPKPDPSEKAAWLDLIRTAAVQGRPWRRLRVVDRPVTEYVRFACEFGYVDNVAAGEDVRVLDAARTQRGEALGRFGAFYVLDGELVAMQYDDGGRFVSAGRASESDAISADGAAAILSATAEAFAVAPDFTEWWAVNPDLHRNLAPR